MKLILNFLIATLRKPIALAKAAASFMNNKLLAWLAWAARLTRLDRLFPWRYFWLVSRPYWTGESSKKAKLLLAVTIALMIASIKAAYYIGVTLKDFTEAINSSGMNGTLATLNQEEGSRALFNNSVKRSATGLAS